MQRPCRAAHRRRLCAVKVNLTMRLPAPANPLRSASHPRRLLKGSGEVGRTKGVKQNGRTRGGVGMPSGLATTTKADREGVLSTLPLFCRLYSVDFVHLHRGGKDAYLNPSP